MKKFLSILILSCLLLTSVFPMLADDRDDDNRYLNFSAYPLFQNFHYYVDEDNEVSIIKYAGNEKSVSVPDRIEGKPVVSIGKMAFAENETIESVNLPNGIEEIEEQAFLGCKRLKRISLPESIEDIEEAAFAYCEALDDVKLPSRLDSIDRGCFFSCASLRQIEIPENVEKIEEHAFQNCTSLSKVTFKGRSRLKEIEIGAFENCQKLADLSLPEGLLELEGGAFDSCSSLTRLRIPSSLYKMDGNPFYNGKIRLENLENHRHFKLEGDFLLSRDGFLLVAYLSDEKQEQLTTPSSVKTIGRGAFYLSQTESIVANGVKEIKGGAFAYCPNLKAVYAPDVEIIDYYVFIGSPNVDEMMVPNSIKYMDDNAFPKDREVPFTLVGLGGEYAKSYAKRNGFSYRLQSSNEGK